jgi:hypothetical protein
VCAGVGVQLISVVFCSSAESRSAARNAPCSNGALQQPFDEFSSLKRLESIVQQGFQGIPRFSLK